MGVLGNQNLGEAGGFIKKKRKLSPELWVGGGYSGYSELGGGVGAKSSGLTIPQWNRYYRKLNLIYYVVTVEQQLNNPT